MFKRKASVGHLVNWAARLFAREADRRLKVVGLSSGQIPVLLALNEKSPLSQRELVDRASTEQPTIAATLARMERDGLVARERDPKDARAWRYSLTDKTHQLMPTVLGALGGGNDLSMAGFTAEERVLTVQLLMRVIYNMTAHEDAIITARRMR